MTGRGAAEGYRAATLERKARDRQVLALLVEAVRTNDVPNEVARSR